MKTKTVLIKCEVPYNTKADTGIEVRIFPGINIDFEIIEPVTVRDIQAEFPTFNEMPFENDHKQQACYWLLKRLGL